MTFAGSPDRVESRLVPEAGFELDTFPISGFPRTPGLGLAARARGGACARRSRASRILGRRRPDVVLGGGGYVAGPMVLAARLRGIPAALTEADAHLGLANRLAAPFARARVPRVRDRRARAARSTASSAARSRVRIAAPRGRRARALRASRGRARCVAVFGALAGARSLNELAVAAWGDAGPRCSTSAASATTTRSRARVHAPRLRRCCRRPTHSARRSPPPTSPSRGRAAPSGSSRPPARPRSSCRTRTRPPTTRRSTRATSSAAAARSSCPTPRSTRVPGARRGAARRSGHGSTEMRAAMLELARPDAADEIADELVALACR